MPMEASSLSPICRRMLWTSDLSGLLHDVLKEEKERKKERTRTEK